MAILLIGSTGSGKSTLGNFLIDPDNEEKLFKRRSQTFKVAPANLPETQIVVQQHFSFKQEDGRTKRLTVIDTPGLNESDLGDLKHMIEIIESLQRVDEILACVFVVNFRTKIDAPYKATVEYYRNLLPSLFERNVIVVMTEYSTDDRSIELRKRQETDVEQIKRNTIREIVESGGLAYTPMLFTIDCLPIGVEEKKLNQDERNAILSKIVSQTPFKSELLKVAKTPALKREDKERIKEYEGEITGYNKRLQQANIRATEALEEIQKKEQELTESTKELRTLEYKLEEMDSNDLVEVASWSVSEEWKLFKWQSYEFVKTSPCEIANVDRWTNGHCEWKNYREDEDRVSGKVQGNFMRGVYASLSIQAHKRKKYAKEIAELKRQKSGFEEHTRLFTQQLNEIQDRYKEYTDDIQLLEEFIEERREMIQFLVSDYMSLDGAKERLEQLKQANK